MNPMLSIRRGTVGVALLIVGLFALGACSSSSGGMSVKQQRYYDCVSAGNAPASCKRWMGE
jgi:hypothetical protein